jgi:transcriptional regulator with XRE-family HTH domain
MTDLGKKIRELRSVRGFTVQQFADEIDKSAGYVSRIEARGEIPSVELILLIAEKLAVKPESLLELAKQSQLGRVAQQIDAKQQEALILYRKGKK